MGKTEPKRAAAEAPKAEALGRPAAREVAIRGSEAESPKANARSPVAAGASAGGGGLKIFFIRGLTVILEE